MGFRIIGNEAKAGHVIRLAQGGSSYGSKLPAAFLRERRGVTCDNPKAERRLFWKQVREIGL